MIDTDDEYGDRRRTSHAPTIAIGIVAFLLLVIGAMSYRDYVRASMEKEFAEKERLLYARAGYPAAAEGSYPAQATASGQTAQPSAQGGPAVAPTYPSTQGTNIESTLPQPNDPEIDSMKESLDNLRQQAARTEQTYNEITQGKTPSVSSKDEEIIVMGEVTSELPDFLKEALKEPPGGNPSVNAEKEALRKQVASSASLATVTGFDPDWGVVAFNAGSSQGVKLQDRFAIRRGDRIVGWVKVDDLQPNSANAYLVSKNRDMDLAAKPQVGDDVIAFELF